MNINERFRDIRKLCDMSQEQLGNILGLSRSGVSEIESGRRNVTDKHIRLLTIDSINGKFINEEWLRTGNGEPFKPLTRAQSITDFAADIIKEDDSFKARLIEALSKLSEDDWKVLEGIAEKLADNKKTRGNP